MDNNQKAASVKRYSFLLASFQTGRNNAQPKRSKAFSALQSQRACSLAGKGNDSSLKLLELDMDLLQTKDLAEIFFLFFFNALADGEYALSIEKLLVFEGNGCLQC